MVETIPSQTTFPPVLPQPQNDPSNASNLASGTVPPSRLPLPTAGTPGVVFAAAAPPHQVQTGIATTGAPLFAQLSFGDLSGQLPSVQAPAFSGVRQTVQAGPVALAAPSFLPAASGALSLTAQNVATGVNALTVAAAQGFNATGQFDVVAQLTTNPTWSALAASATNYLFINAQTGTTVSSTLQPIYQFGGPIPTGSNQFTFDHQAYVGYLGNGTSAVPTPLVCVGEAMANATGVTGTIAYAYSGAYDSGWTSTLPAPNTLTFQSHNLGVTVDAIGAATFAIQNTTAEFGYAGGDTLLRVSTSTGSGFLVAAPVLGRLSVGLTTGAGGFVGLNKVSGASVGFTAANWRWKLVVGRGW